MAKDLRVKISSDTGEAVSGIKKVIAEVDNLDVKATEAASGVDRLNDEVRELGGDATAKAASGVKKVKTEADGLEKTKVPQTAQSMAANLIKAGLAAAGVSLSIGMVISSAREMVALHAVQAQAEASLAAAIRATGQESVYTVGDLKDYAGALQAVTTFGDEAILTIQQMMVQTGKIGKDIMPVATEAALDMAVALGTDVHTNAKKLARALEDPVQGITLLKESMVTFNPVQQETIKRLTAQGDAAGAQKVILEELTRTYGGLARAQGQIDVNKIQQIKNTIGDIKEGLGASIVDGMAPAMDWLLRKLGEVNDRIAEANQRSGVTSPKDMSTADLMAHTGEDRRAEVEGLRKKIATSMPGVGYMGSVPAWLPGMEAEVKAYDAMVAELNARAREAGYAAATAYGQAYMSAMAKQRLEQPLTPAEEKLAARAAGAIPGVSPTLAAGDGLNKAALDAQDKALALVTQTAGYQRMILENRIAELEALKASNVEAMAKVSHSRDLLAMYERSNTLIDEQLALDYKLRDGQTDMETFLAANATYARETKEQEQERLALALATAEAYLLQNTLTEEQRQGMARIVTGLKESLAGFEEPAAPEAPSGVEAFLEKNASYARETADQERQRLLAALDIATAYQRQADLTDAQRESLGLIITGLQAGINAIPGAVGEVLPTIREQLEAAFEARIPTTGIKKWAIEAQDAVASVTSFLQDNFGAMADLGISFYETMVKAQADAAKAQVGILERQIAAEKKLQEKQTKAVQSQYDKRGQALADRYAWGLIEYGDYIAAQQALDDEKTASEEASASRVAALEKQKADIQNAVSKTAFENTKRQSIAQALILGAQAVLQGYATLGPIGGTIAAAVIAGVTAAQIGVISSQQYTPATALAAGGIAYKPTSAIIGEGGEPEMVLPLSRAESMGFTGAGTHESTLVINVNAPTYTGRDLTDAVYEGISMAQRTGRLPAWGGR
jgi:hypothetical protein